MNNQQKVGAIIVAAGESKRMEGIDKVLAPLGGRPILLRVIDAFQRCRLITQIIVVVNEKSIETCRLMVNGGGWDKVSNKVSDVCLGGRRRQDSVAAGLSQLKNCDWVVIHDGARPLVTVDLIERGLEAARETGSAVAAVPVTDTIKVVGENEIVMGTPPRQNLRVVQTPQVFRFDIITRAYQKANDDVTDDASLAEKAGYKVKLYMGSYDNIKVTTPHDLALAEILLKKRGE
jgi:2-C-methyl-D-erythritol 4-phosphate cytidylyltransferase